MEQNILELAQYGVTGVAIALIILIAYLGKIVSNLIQNHLQHNNDVMSNLKDTIKELYVYLKNKNGNK